MKTVFSVKPDDAEIFARLPKAEQDRVLGLLAYFRSAEASGSALDYIERMPTMEPAPFGLTRPYLYIQYLKARAGGWKLLVKTIGLRGELREHFRAAREVAPTSRPRKRKPSVRPVHTLKAGFLAWKKMQRDAAIVTRVWCIAWWNDDSIPRPPMEVIHADTPDISLARARAELREIGFTAAAAERATSSKLTFQEAA